mmetsp:Transcript_49134/g.117033  ORF Transcript_49134/g.117033 Transcript_49134/m.117033 type:complete len:245 (+) Transcript_49134:99-833(+)
MAILEESVNADPASPRAMCGAGGWRMTSPREGAGFKPSQTQTRIDRNRRCQGSRSPSPLQTPRGDAPVTPRQLTPRPRTPRSPPHTPVNARVARSLTPPPAPRPQKVHKLLRALHMNSLEEVQKALANDPEAASLPFLEHEWEPPLCVAARLNCSVEIVEMLLAHGADAQATDMYGRSPAKMLSMMAGTTADGHDEKLTNEQLLRAVVAARVRREQELPIFENPFLQGPIGGEVGHGMVRFAGA